MTRVVHFFPLIFLGVFLIGSAWSQLLNTQYTHRELNFFEEQDDLEGYENFKFRLIPHTEIYINTDVGLGFITEKDNASLVQDLLDAAKNTVNASRDPTNQYLQFRDNHVIPYQIGLNIDVFIYNYFGIGFTYSRNHQFSHLSSISPPLSDNNTNAYNQTVAYTINSAGNNFQFSLMGRYPLGKRLDNNIYLVGGLGYTLSTAVLTLGFEDKLNQVYREEEYTALSHGFHVFSEVILRVSYFNFGLGLLLTTNTFSDFTLPDNPEITPKKYGGIKLGPTLYFKIGFNI